MWNRGDIRSIYGNKKFLKLVTSELQNRGYCPLRQNLSNLGRFMKENFRKMNPWVVLGYFLASNKNKQTHAFM